MGSEFSGQIVFVSEETGADLEEDIAAAIRKHTGRPANNEAVHAFVANLAWDERSGEPV